MLDSLHTVYLLMRSDQENLLFAAPIQDPKRILDIGTGTGEWAIDVADKYPDASVHGVDLFPSPNTWVPPNCFLEVEDVAKVSCPEIGGGSFFGWIPHIFVVERY